MADATGWELAAHRRVRFDYDPLYREFDRQNFVERGGVTARLVIEEFRSCPPASASLCLQMESRNTLLIARTISELLRAFL